MLVDTSAEAGYIRLWLCHAKPFEAMSFPTPRLCCDPHDYFSLMLQSSQLELYMG